ncbi:MAG: class I SAM-dependent methyltransferase [Candidatus Binatales bacterium]
MQIDQRFFRRIDESDDALFYSAPRRVVHIDDGAIAAVAEIFASRIPRGAAILDLMSSWRSHLPPEIAPAKVTGLGMNRAEMEDNPALTEIVIHDLNRDPHLPFGDAGFDAAVLTVSVQYITHPIEVFTEVGRVLKAGAPFVVSFSNRMFHTKAVALWLEATDEQRVALVRRYFMESGVFGDIEVIDKSRRDGPRSDQESDPIWAIAGCRAGK